MSKHGKSDLLPDDRATSPAAPEASDADEVTLVATKKETAEVTQVATPSGAFVPLSEVASFDRGRAPTSIEREGGLIFNRGTRRP